MSHRIEVSAYAAIPAVLALAAGAYLMKPEELRRNPLLEAQGLVGLATKYEVMYANCADGTDASSLDAKGIAKGLAGGYTHTFPAKNDEDALTFARGARPQCRLSSLYRLERRVFGSSSATRYNRTRIDV